VVADAPGINMLRIVVATGPGQVTLTLEGSLAGPWVVELEDAWRAARPGLHDRSLCVDLTAVDHVDEAGKYLLALLSRDGAHLTTAGAAMTELVRAIAEDWPPREK
jgi:ABC-type transporter Mla MlaB component